MVGSWVHDIGKVGLGSKICNLSYNYICPVYVGQTHYFTGATICPTVDGSGDWVHALWSDSAVNGSERNNEAMYVRQINGWI